LEEVAKLTRDRAELLDALRIICVDASLSPEHVRKIAKAAMVAVTRKK